MTTYAEQLLKIRNELLVLSVDVFNELGPECEASSLLAKAVNSVRDAKLCIENPRLKTMMCLICNKEVTAHICGPSSAFLPTTLCQIKINGSERMRTEERVPTCADCIRIAFGEK